MQGQIVRARIHPLECICGSHMSVKKFLPASWMGQEFTELLPASFTTLNVLMAVVMNDLSALLMSL